MHVLLRCYCLEGFTASVLKLFKIVGGGVGEILKEMLIGKASQ